MNKTLKNLEKFHGHIGPYLIIGFKMGQIANNNLGKDPFCKKAVAWTGTNPPLSCIIDGIQLSSGCTLGKGNITVKQERYAKVEFSDKNGKKIIIQLKPEIQREINTTVTEKNIKSYSEQLFEKTDEELFEVSFKDI